jgi:hypothetical protein
MGSHDITTCLYFGVFGARIYNEKKKIGTNSLKEAVKEKDR